MTTNDTTKTWAEIDALKQQLNRGVIARRQSKIRLTAEDRFLVRCYGNANTRVRVFVDANGRPVE